MCRQSWASDSIRAGLASHNVLWAYVQHCSDHPERAAQVYTISDLLAGEVQVYYHNPSTRESSWQKPEGFEGDAESAGAAPRPVSSNQIPNTGWSEVTCSDGRKYYYHAKREVQLLAASGIYKCQ